VTLTRPETSRGDLGGVAVQPPDYTFDPARLGALADFAILDTPAERGFDDIVELSRHICETPVALVSFVTNDRQWFKARVGFDGCETDLNSSVCAHALIEPDLSIVPDLSKDPRTQANPLVVGDPFIRFYAGAPLRTASGQVLGSLCVIDTKPRPAGLTDPQADALRNLGRLVVSQLELRQAVAQRDVLLAMQAEAEEQQQLLNGELGHRMKNTMALVQAVASQTLKAVPDQGPVKAFSERMLALSGAHDVLLQKNWTSSLFSDVVESAICTFSDIDRFDLAGPKVTLGSRATMSLALLTHELTANALKYGALSNNEGRVKIAWELTSQDDQRLRLQWIETGGPMVITPTRKGFGSRLINMGLAGSGDVELFYDPLGFSADFVAPLSELQT
jgi:two-component sensor histidine kinase